MICEKEKTNHNHECDISVITQDQGCEGAA